MGPKNILDLCPMISPVLAFISSVELGGNKVLVVVILALLLEVQLDPVECTSSHRTLGTKICYRYATCKEMQRALVRLS